MKEALQLALEALEYWDVQGGLHQPTEEAITAIKAALAQPRTFNHMKDGQVYVPDKTEPARPGAMDAFKVQSRGYPT